MAFIYFYLAHCIRLIRKITVFEAVWHQTLMRDLFLASASPVAMPLITDSSS